ncbi:class I SAM-dependent methyltransferase [Aureliella helgolandensis]|uniref:Trans-aconitate 2-methyltransferase n=1 Tax=Aureliella helgolandensis TaxID=2527968 RepID=A0A518G4L3_9BACT|nr:class I SAM-dependent methyltransferase [Aureliella helgolandensis]QDV23490.1 Trans-aconitate 2-methyltransferase [Aureliella helgolandensis]
MSRATLDKTKIDKFWQERTQFSDPRIATNYRDDGRLQFDCDLVQSLATPSSRVLDLGAGTCTLSAMLEPYVASVLAVDKYPRFLEHAPKTEKFSTACADVTEFRSQQLFDLILLIGVVNYLSVHDEIELYKRCADMLASGGSFVVKNQCGIKEERVVDKFSEELGTHYHARYPAFQSQLELLSQLFCVSPVDIYPPEINRWEDTHFYAFVCTGKPPV